MDRLEEIKKEEVNLENQKIRFTQAKTKEDKIAAEIWIKIIRDRLQVLKKDDSKRV